MFPNVCLRITKNRKIKVISLKIKVLPKDWNFKNKTVKKSDVQYFRKNKLLRYYSKKANDIIDNHLFSNKPLSIAEFTNLFKDASYNDNNFFSFIKSEIENRNFAYETKRTYIAHLSKIKKFRSSINIESIDLSFILDYKSYMLKTLKNNENTMYKSMAILKNFINWAIQKDMINDNPFKKFPIKKIEGNRTFLDLHELDKLENLLNSNKLSVNKKEILEYFLFDCYTGLRYKDLKELIYSKIKTIYDNSTAFKVIDTVQHKTNKPVTIPLIERSKKFLKTDFLPNERIFKVRANQVTNRRLKEIMKIAGIDKNITVDCARHTFATVGIDLGIPIEVVSKMLGHTDIRTTLIYARIRDGRKFEELSKLDK